VGNINQVQINFSALEDRLLMRIKTQDLAEYRFWLTRRFVKLLWPVLVRMLAADAAVRHQGDADAQNAIVSFRHEQAVQQSDFESTYDPNVMSTPLGVEPVLLAGVQIKDPPGARAVLCLLPLRGQGIDVAMTEVMLHSFCKLLADAVTTAEWDMQLGIVQPQEANARSRSLN